VAVAGERPRPLTVKRLQPARGAQSPRESERAKPAYVGIEKGVTTMDAGLILVRLAIGPLMAAHGAQKLLGWFGGYGLTGTGGFFEGLGFRPGRLFAAAASVTEIVSGVLVTLGLFGPIGPALMVSVMVVAAFSVHWPNVFAQSNGIEVPLLYAASAAALALTGFGAYSLDAALGLTPLWTPAVSWIALAIGALGGLANLGLRRPPAQAAAHA
jgi:putative oxidoreductase